MKRFHNKYRINAKTGCWNWTAHTDRYGYGRIQIKGKSERAHRVSWIIHNGTIPEGLHVLHHCDNPRCVNPSHLFLGSNLDNMKDKVLKGRQPNHIGVNNPGSKLSEQDVMTIRSEFNNKLPACNEYTRIANKYNIHWVTVEGIIKRKTWNHL